MLITMLSLLAFAQDGTFRLTETVGDPDGANLRVNFTIDSDEALAWAKADFGTEPLFTYESTLYGEIRATAGDPAATFGPFSIGSGCLWSAIGCGDGFSDRPAAGQAAILDIWRGAMRASIDEVADVAALSFMAGDERATLTFAWREALADRDWAEFYCDAGMCYNADHDYIGETQAHDPLAIRVDIRETGGGKRVAFVAQAWRQAKFAPPTDVALWFTTDDELDSGDDKLTSGSKDGVCADRESCMQGQLMRTRIKSTAPRAVANALAGDLQEAGLTYTGWLTIDTDENALEGDLQEAGLGGSTLVGFGPDNAAADAGDDPGDDGLDVSFSLTAPDRSTTLDGLGAPLVVNRRTTRLRDLMVTAARDDIDALRSAAAEGTLEGRTCGDDDDGAVIAELSVDLSYRIVSGSLANMRQVAWGAALTSTPDTDLSDATATCEAFGFTVDHLTEGRGTTMVMRFAATLDFDAFEDEITLVYRVDGAEGVDARAEVWSLGRGDLIDKIAEKASLKKADAAAAMLIIPTQELDDDEDYTGTMPVVFVVREPVAVDPRTGRISTPTGLASLTVLSGETTIETRLETQRFVSNVALSDVPLPVVVPPGDEEREALLLGLSHNGPSETVVFEYSSLKLDYD